MQNCLFILSFFVVTWTSVAHASVCVYPDDGNDFYVRPTDCPRIDWSLAEGNMSLPDRGELIWADASGRVHYERSLAEVPEPYHSMYRQGRRTAQGTLEFDTEPQATPPGLDSESATEQVIAARDQWRSLTGGWQAELYASLRELLQAMMRPAPLAFNPMLQYTPAGRTIVGGTQQQVVQDARTRALRARHMLLDVLPRMARAQGAPPAWLRQQAVR